MTCGVCLEDDVEVINIFNEEGVQLKIASIIGQHFWFEPSEGDPILSQICSSCWEQIGNFHIFYTAVKEAHKKLKESYYSRQIIDDGQVFEIDDSDTIEDSDEEQSDRDATENGVDADAVKNGASEMKIPKGRSRSEQEVNTNENLPDGAQLFFKQEHESLLEQYSYVESSVQDVVGQDFDDDYYAENEFHRPTFNSKATNQIKIKSEPIEPFHDDNGWEQEQTFVESTSRKGIANSRKQSRGKQNSLDGEEKTKAEEELIAKHINLECEQCYVKLSTFYELSRHYQAAHNISGYVRCCDKKLPSRSYVLDHINQHINPDNYKCKECNKSFSTQYAIKNHLAMIHAPESSKIYKCKECPKRFTNDHSLNMHLSQHKNEKEKRLYCIECRKTFPTATAIQMHRNVYHKRLLGHICHVCGVVVRGKKNFGKHIQDHAIELGSEAINDPVCPLCGKLSASIKTLRHHIRYVHSAFRPHKCPICGKAFKIRQKLKEHMGTHAVGVSLPCPYCPKRFRSNIHVYSHKYRMHKDEYEKEKTARLQAASNGTYTHFAMSYDPTTRIYSNPQPYADDGDDGDDDDCYVVT